MASKKKVTAPVNEPIAEAVEENNDLLIAENELMVEETPAPAKEEAPVSKNKFKVGDVVFVSKDADADMNGFKLFPQYKKYAYTVEAYDAKSGVYTLRKLNLSLRLKEELILAPGERGGNSLSRKQF